METRIKTTITFINRRTKETQTESFYSVFNKDKPASDQLNSNNDYWRFNIEKLGGHKVLCSSTYLVFLR